MNEDLEPQMGEAPAGQVEAARAEAPAEAGQEPAIRVTTSRFGTLSVDPGLVFTFPSGLVGFERCLRFVALRQNPDTALGWLQCLDDPAVAFPVIEPRLFRVSYSPTISDADACALGLDRDEPVLVLAIVTVPAQRPRDMTANLLAPLVVNAVTRVGRQVIVEDDCFTTRHRVLEELLEAATGSADPPALAAPAAGAADSGREAEEVAA